MCSAACSFLTGECFSPLLFPLNDLFLTCLNLGYLLHIAKLKSKMVFVLKILDCRHLQSTYLFVLYEIYQSDIIPQPAYCTVTIVLGLLLGVG